MAKFRVWAECISDVYVDIEAKDEDQAYYYAKDVLDGADFHDSGEGDWNMGMVTELEDDADIDFCITWEEN